MWGTFGKKGAPERAAPAPQKDFASGPREVPPRSEPRRVQVLTTQGTVTHLWLLKTNPLEIPACCRFAFLPSPCLRTMIGP